MNRGAGEIVEEAIKKKAAPRTKRINNVATPATLKKKMEGKGKETEVWRATMAGGAIMAVVRHHHHQKEVKGSCDAVRVGASRQKLRCTYVLMIKGCTPGGAG